MRGKPFFFIAFFALAALLAAIAAGYLGFWRLQRPLIASVAQHVKSASANVTQAVSIHLAQRDLAPVFASAPKPCSNSERTSSPSYSSRDLRLVAVG